LSILPDFLASASAAYLPIRRMCNLLACRML
jgi:hypothetical protein